VGKERPETIFQEFLAFHVFSNRQPSAKGL